MTFGFLDKSDPMYGKVNWAQAIRNWEQSRAPLSSPAGGKVPQIAYVPQEYPKMVPGPNGPQIVQDRNEEYSVLTARIEAMGPARWDEAEHLIDRREELLNHAVASPEPDITEHMYGDPEWCPKTPTGEANAKASERSEVIGPGGPGLGWAVDVDAWNWSRKTLSHDWIGALYRPYEPPV